MARKVCCRPIVCLEQDSEDNIMKNLIQNEDSIKPQLERMGIHFLALPFHSIILYYFTNLHGLYAQPIELRRTTIPKKKSYAFPCLFTLASPSLGLHRPVMPSTIQSKVIHFLTINSELQSWKRLKSNILI